MLVLELVGSEAESMVELRDDADEQALTERRKMPILLSDSFLSFYYLLL